MIVEKSIIEKLTSLEKVTIGFSLGKDSLACACVLKQLGIKYIPFYFFHIPNLEFVNDQIDLYSNIFDIEIIQMPHPMLYDNLRHQDFMDKQTADYIAGFDIPKMTFDSMINAYLKENGSPKLFDIVGMRAAESFNRRKFFERVGGIDELKNKIYPIWNWKKADVLQLLANNKVPLSADYKIWNRSFDGLKYQFLFGVKKHYPKDFIKIKEYFPLIDLELKRYEFNLEYFK